MNRHSGQRVVHPFPFQDNSCKKWRTEQKNKLLYLLQEYNEATGNFDPCDQMLKRLFPEAVLTLQGASQDKDKADRTVNGLSPGWDDCLNGFTQLNSLMAMTYQMRSDISNGHHKYMAHQSALLFRSLTPFEFGPRFKKRIQQRFAELKGISEGNQTPRMSTEQTIWMETILDDIIQFVESHPPSVRKMMGPMAKFVGEGLQ